MSSFSLAIRVGGPTLDMPTSWAKWHDVGFKSRAGVGFHEHHWLLFSFDDVDDGKVFRNKLAALSGFQEHDGVWLSYYHTLDCDKCCWVGMECGWGPTVGSSCQDESWPEDCQGQVKRRCRSSMGWGRSVYVWCTPKATRPVTTRLACGGMRECYSWRQWWSRAQRDMGWCPCLWTGVLPFKAFCIAQAKFFFKLEAIWDALRGAMLVKRSLDSLCVLEMRVQWLGCGCEEKKMYWEMSEGVFHSYIFHK